MTESGNETNRHILQETNQLIHLVLSQTDWSTRFQ